MPSTNGHGSEPERVALYLRVSSEEQRDRKTINIQRGFLEQYHSTVQKLAHTLGVEPTDLMLRRTKG
jgi:hypothetical protein